MAASLIYVKFAYTPEGATDPIEDYRNVVATNGDTREAVEKFLTWFTQAYPGITPRIITTEFRADVHLV